MPALPGENLPVHAERSPLATTWEESTPKGLLYNLWIMLLGPIFGDQEGQAALGPQKLGHLDFLIVYGQLCVSRGLNWVNTRCEVKIHIVRINMSKPKWILIYTLSYPYVSYHNQSMVGPNAIG